MILTLHLNLFTTGCGTNIVSSAGGWVRVPLAGTSLAGSLAGSGFGAATALEINPLSNEFRLVLPEGTRSVSGNVRRTDGGAEVSSIQFGAGGAWVQFELDSARHVTQMSTSRGQVWHPSQPFGEPLSLLGNSGVDAYVAANQELVLAARRSGGSNGTTTPPGTGPVVTPPTGGPKGAVGAQTISIPSDVLSLLTIVVVLQGVVANFPALFFVFQAVVGINFLTGLLGGATQTTTGTPVTTTPGPKDQVGPPTGDGALRVFNHLTAAPIWYVVLPQDGEGVGGNLLGEESIPAGESRDFAVPTGTRDVLVIVPTDADCYVVYTWLQLDFEKGVVVEIEITPNDAGDPYPSRCAGG